MKIKHILISLVLIWRISVIFILAKNKNTEISEIKEPISKTTTGEQTPELLETSKDKKTKAAQDLEALKKIYEVNKSEDILKQIIEKQAQNYQFNDAIENIKQLSNPEEKIEPQLYLYIAINSSALKVGDPQSINTIMQVVDSFKTQGRIDNDDAVFYQWLKEIWNRNYNQALIYRETIQKAEYKTTIAAFREAISGHKTEKSIPTEYTDGLVSLTALKNGYFNIARKIAVECIDKNQKYILPYQILAYSHFLSNNWDTAIEYFLQLADFDTSNKDMYKFLIGSSYYRKGEYSSSVLYLNQVKKTNLSDTMRYLVQDYLQLNTLDKAKGIRTLLGKQNDISPSDFSLYFYSILYKSYFSMDSITVGKYKELTDIFIQNCIDRYPENDVCIYGQFGKAALENTIDVNLGQYTQLAQRYNMSYLHHILWDYFTKTKDIKKAQESYAKAFALTEDGNEKTVLRQKIQQSE